MRKILLVLVSCSCAFPTEGTATNPTTGESETEGESSEVTSDSTTETDPSTTSESTTEQTTADTTDATTMDATTMDATSVETTETSETTDATTDPTSESDTDPTEGAEFDAVQFYCSGTCRATKPSAGGDGCDADDANTFCQLMYGDPAYTAVSWETVPTLDGPGFCCLELGDQDNHLTDVEGYGEVCFEPDSLLPAHESGLVIPFSTLVCSMGG